MIDISIIIPAYNAEKFLSKCLTTCINQDIPHSDYEIIVINDGSKDNTLDIAKDFESKYSNIHVFSQENKGLSATRNRAVRHAQGQYIWFVDSDDWIAENCLSRIVDACKKKNLDALGICVAHIVNDRPRRTFYYRCPEVISGLDALKRNMLRTCSPYTICKKELLIDSDLKFKEGIFHEDNEFSVMLLCRAKRVSYIDDIVYFLYPNLDSITRSKNLSKQIKRMNDMVIVANDLSDFMNEVSSEYHPYISDYVFKTLFAAVELSAKLPQEHQKSLERRLINANNIINVTKKSHVFAFRIVSFLMGLFPKLTYKTLMLYFKKIKKSRQRYLD